MYDEYIAFANIEVRIIQIMNKIAINCLFIDLFLYKRVKCCVNFNVKQEFIFATIFFTKQAVISEFSNCIN